MKTYLFNRDLSPSLNVQSDLIQAKLCVKLHVINYFVILMASTKSRPDWTGLDQGLDHGSDHRMGHGSDHRKNKIKKKKSKKVKSFTR